MTDVKHIFRNLPYVVCCIAAVFFLNYCSDEQSVIPHAQLPQDTTKLKIMLDAGISDKQRIQVFLALFEMAYDHNNLRLSIPYIEEGIEISKRNKDYMHYAVFSNKKGLIHTKNHEFLVAIKQHLIAKKIFTQLNLPERLYRTDNYIAVIYGRTGNFEAAIPYIKQSINGMIKYNKSDIYYLVLLHSNLGISYREKQHPDIDSALHHIKMGLYYCNFLDYRAYYTGWIWLGH